MVKLKQQLFYTCNKGTSVALEEGRTWWNLYLGLFLFSDGLHVRERANIFFLRSILVIPVALSGKRLVK